MAEPKPYSAGWFYFHTRQRLAKWRQAIARPAVQRVNFGDLRRLRPVSDDFGFDRGTPIDRYYIEKFLAQQTGDIQGCVLEIANNAYTKKFGGARVAASHVLHNKKGNPHATFTGDLVDAPQVPSDFFDCIILTQTLHYIYNFQSAVNTLDRILKPGGVLLCTVPGISQIDRKELGYGWYWAFTSRSMQQLMADHFGEENVRVEGYGNVLAAVAFLEGLSAEELSASELDTRDPTYEILVTARAVKPGKGG